ncbi:MAG: carboxypeptidase-like regulatory domain-containing protein [Aureliella sp.]
MRSWASVSSYGLGDFLSPAPGRRRLARVAARRARWVCLGAWAALFALACPGCGSGDGLNRKAISGIVTVDGRPVPNGSVGFEPLVSGGVGSGAVITDGKYAIGKDDGLPPGKYRVRITGDEGENFGVSEGKMPGDEIMPPRKSLVPASWNSGSKQEIEVKDDGPFEFDFAIDTKKK